MVKILKSSRHPGGQVTCSPATSKSCEMWQSLTLKIRTVGILCIVFILSQMVTLLIFEHNRDNVILSTEATDLADRVIGIVDLAYQFPEDERKPILAAAETQFLTLFSRKAMNASF